MVGEFACVFKERGYLNKAQYQDKCLIRYFYSAVVLNALKTTTKEEKTKIKSGKNKRRKT